MMQASDTQGGQVESAGGAPRSAAPPPYGAHTPQLGLWAAIASLSYVFWVVGGMELIERLAYYGVKAVATLYAKEPAAKGGLGVSMTQFGTVLMVWAFVQSILPVFSGGLSDRYGYKETIFVSTVVKIAGYLTMAFFPSYHGFFAGAVLLAAGTATFKPGIQGTLVKATHRGNSSMAWGIFYQLVNVGGFLGPLVAGMMRKLEWRQVFFACAGIIALNFLMLLTYQEVGKEARLRHREQQRLGSAPRRALWHDALDELRQPHVWLYLLIFSGFWFMFNALFDVFPAHVDDWVDTRDILHTLGYGQGLAHPVLKFFVVTNADGTAIQPEGMINLNCGLIMTTCFLFAALSARLRPTTSMVLGTLLATVALFYAGSAVSGWACVVAITVFSIGEMLSSPKFSEFMGHLAPDNKKAMYLGFSQISLAVGWTLEGKLGPMLYDILASKDRFSRAMLHRLGMTDLEIAGIAQGEAFDYLVRHTGQPPEQLTAFLYENHHVAVVWYIMGLVGVASAVGLFCYGRWLAQGKWHASVKVESSAH